MALNLNVDLTDLSIDQQRQILPKIGKLANSRLYRLRRNGINYYAAERATLYLNNLGRRTFPTIPNTLTDFQIKRFIAETQAFLNSKSSTLRGLKQIRSNTIDRFRDKGLTITDEKTFFDFLSSAQFKALKEHGDSETIIEDFDTALNEGFSMNQIQKQYQEFLDNTYMTFEQVAERRIALPSLQ